MSPTTPRDTGRPGGLALPASAEFWQMLERFNKVALAKRFPGWGERGDGRTGR